MKPKTDKNGVRRAVFSAADVTLWYRMQDSLLDYENIMRGSPMQEIAHRVQGSLEAILIHNRGQKADAAVPNAALDEESDGD